MFWFFWSGCRRGFLLFSKFCRSGLSSGSSFWWFSRLSLWRSGSGCSRVCLRLRRGTTNTLTTVSSSVSLTPSDFCDLTQKSDGIRIPHMASMRASTLRCLSHASVRRVGCCLPFVGVVFITKSPTETTKGFPSDFASSRFDLGFFLARLSERARKS